MDEQGTEVRRHPLALSDGGAAQRALRRSSSRAGAGRSRRADSIATGGSRRSERSAPARRPSEGQARRASATCRAAACITRTAVREARPAPRVDEFAAAARLSRSPIGRRRRPGAALPVEDEARSPGALLEKNAEEAEAALLDDVMLRARDRAVKASTRPRGTADDLGVSVDALRFLYKGGDVYGGDGRRHRTHGGRSTPPPATPCEEETTERKGAVTRMTATRRAPVVESNLYGEPALLHPWD